MRHARDARGAVCNWVRNLQPLLLVNACVSVLTTASMRVRLRCWQLRQALREFLRIAVVTKGTSQHDLAFLRCAQILEVDDFVATAVEFGLMLTLLAGLVLATGTASSEGYDTHMGAILIFINALGIIVTVVASFGTSLGSTCDALTLQWLTPCVRAASVVIKRWQEQQAAKQDAAVMGKGELVMVKSFSAPQDLPRPHTTQVDQPSPSSEDTATTDKAQPDPVNTVVAAASHAIDSHDLDTTRPPSATSQADDDKSAKADAFGVASPLGEQGSSGPEPASALPTPVRSRLAVPRTLHDNLV